MQRKMKPTYDILSQWPVTAKGYFIWQRFFFLFLPALVRQRIPYTNLEEVLELRSAVGKITLSRIKREKRLCSHSRIRYQYNFFFPFSNRVTELAQEMELKARQQQAAQQNAQHASHSDRSASKSPLQGKYQFLLLLLLLLLFFFFIFFVLIFVLDSILESVVKYSDNYLSESQRENINIATCIFSFLFSRI